MAPEVALPPGFELDGQLPPGFQVDHPSVIEQEGYGARPVLRAARDVASGAAGLVDLVEKPVRLTIAEGLDALGHKDIANTMRERATLSETVQGGFDTATGGITTPRDTHDKISDAIGEVITPGIPGLARAAGAAETATKAAVAMAPKAKTAEELTEIYKAGRESLSDVNLTGEQVKTGLVDPVLEALKSENPARYGAVVHSTIQELKSFAKTGVNANFLESFRQDLRELPQKFAQPIRDAIDNLYETSDLPTEFRDAYALMKRGETLSNMLTKAGDSITKQRNAINSFLVKQPNLTEYERQALEKTGKASTTEGLLRVIGSTMKPFGYFGSLLSLPAGLTAAAGGEALKAGANKLAQGKIEKAVQAVKGRSLEDLAK